jgi:hypothetical protein
MEERDSASQDAHNDCDIASLLAFPELKRNSPQKENPMYNRTYRSLTTDTEATNGGRQAS